MEKDGDLRRGIVLMTYWLNCFETNSNELNNLEAAM